MSGLRCRSDWPTAGGGTSGLLHCAQPGVYFDEAFEGNRHTLPVTFDAATGAGNHSGEIVIDSSAGERRVPFRARVGVSAAPSLASVTVFSWGVLGMLTGLSLRWLPMVPGGSLSGGPWLDGDAVLPRAPLTCLLFGGVLWMVLLVLTVGEATRRRSWAFLLSGATAALPVALIAALAANLLLVGGDLALRPAMSDLVRSWAAGGWLVLGGIAGAAYGTLRRLNDLFSRRFLQILLGWLFFAGTMCGIVPGRHGRAAAAVHPRRLAAAGPHRGGAVTIRDLGSPAPGAIMVELLPPERRQDRQVPGALPDRYGHRARLFPQRGGAQLRAAQPRSGRAAGGGGNRLGHRDGGATTRLLEEANTTS